MRHSTCGCLSSFGIGLRPQRSHASRGRQSGAKRKATAARSYGRIFRRHHRVVLQVVDAVKLPTDVPVQALRKTKMLTSFSTPTDTKVLLDTFV
jgi:hypothetical protein